MENRLFVLRFGTVVRKIPERPECLHDGIPVDRYGLNNHRDSSKRMYSRKMTHAPQTTIVWLVCAVMLQTVLSGSGGHELSAQVEMPDRKVLEAAGLRVIEGDHITLITDARDRTDVDEFPRVFELAIAQWCQYFSIDPELATSWKITACVMVDKDRFRRAGLFPEELPPFPAGFQSGDWLWLYVQEGDYYTRHLLLHEGTHAFMQRFLGGLGAPWYAEGMAELLALHRWKDDQLAIRHMPATTDEVPWWGRVKLIRQDRDEGRGLLLDEVMQLPTESFRNVNSYGWAWAACMFLDGHPSASAVFRSLPARMPMRPDELNRVVKQELAMAGLDSPDLEFQWQAMIDEIDYGHDVQRALPGNGKVVQQGESATVTVATDRGWQLTGIDLQGGQAVRLDVEGRFTIKSGDTPWLSGPAGVTIEYYRGRPLGELVAAIRVDDDAGGETGKSLKPVSVGAGGVIRFDGPGELCLRINEAPGGLFDNQGELTVTIRPESD
jgi:hypothetical protein